MQNNLIDKKIVDQKLAVYANIFRASIERIYYFLQNVNNIFVKKY